jgi:hypothetical protein
MPLVNLDTHADRVAVGSPGGLPVVQQQVGFHDFKSQRDVAPTEGCADLAHNGFTGGDQLHHAQALDLGKVQQASHMAGLFLGPLGPNVLNVVVDLGLQFAPGAHHLGLHTDAVADHVVGDHAHGMFGVFVVAHQLAAAGPQDAQAGQYLAVGAGVQR